MRRYSLLMSAICLLGFGGAAWGTSGELLQSFNNPTPGAYDRFGSSLAVDGTTLLIGAHGDSNAGAANAGAAHLFSLNTGQLSRSFLNPTAALDDYFGYSVAVSGSMVAVSAP